jgi:multidrug resistance efflux pump
MLELLLCSLFTLVPDYLYRRYGQGKRIGREITLYSVWFELRWGITTCLILAVLLITVIFYNHPSTTSATVMFRTIPIAPERIGRVAEVNIAGLSEDVKQGQPLFRLDTQQQEAAAELARRKIAEVDATLIAARADVVGAEGQIQQAESALQQAQDELSTKEELMSRNSATVAVRELEKLRVRVEGQKGAVASAKAAKDSADLRISTLLPAQKASAQAALAEAEAGIDKSVIRAGVDGRVEQFVLRVGDVVNPMARPAGILIPKGAGERAIQAGFGQIEGQVMQIGMAAEVTCISKPFTVIPMVVTGIQAFIAAGQYRGGEQLIDAQQIGKPGTLLVTLEPLYSGGLEGVIPGSSCIANAYSSNHDLIASGEAGFFWGLALHGVDATGIVHAIILRIQALLLPIKLLVLSGH